MAAVDELTPRQRHFVDLYLGSARWNGTKAAMLAEYKHPAVQASQLLSMVKIKAAIAERLAQAAMTADECLARLADHARADVDWFLDDHGAFDLAKARKAGKTHLLRQIKYEQEMASGDEEGQGLIRKVSFSIEDRLKALELIGKGHRLFVERQEHTGAEGGPIRLRWDDAGLEAEADDD